MSLDFTKIFILIPALNPTEEFIKYVNELIDNNFKNIVIVNDGSSKEYADIFRKVSVNKECYLIEHTTNQGKGKALKDGLKYIKQLDIFSQSLGVITVDCDGQHLVKDIIGVAEKMIANSNSLILGSRNFNNDNVPKKSSFGNKTTSNVIKLLYGVKINDTQTGLRGIPKDLIEQFIKISGNRYEYEMNMLIECISNKIQIIEMPIETIYIDNNSNSHFRPIKDSLSIYYRVMNSFIKYSAFSIVSCVIDIALFQIFLILLKSKAQINLIMVATILARFISSLINYGLNKKFTFDSKKSVTKTIVKYYILCIIQMLLSGLFVSVIYNFMGGSEVIIKLIVDTILFIINYTVQKRIIF